MKDDPGKIQRLFRKYLADECSPEEKAEIMAWFDQEHNEQDLKELIRSEFERGIPVGEDSLRVQDEVYQSFDWASGREDTRRLSWRMPRISRLAAAAILLGAILGLAAVAYLYTSGRLFSWNVMTASTGVGERKQVKLDDGTVVWLNAVSSLVYPAHFSGSAREVTLEGEAFFDVAHRQEMPFVIRSGSLKTTVLGTTFNIRAYREDRTMSVEVVTGRVKVTTPEEELHLEPDQQAVFDKEHHKLERKLKAPASEIASWREGELQFRNTTFAEVTATLQRRRGVEIRYDTRLENCPIIHADFHERESLESILGTLMMSVNGSVEKTEDGAYQLKSTMECNP